MEFDPITGEPLGPRPSPARAGSRRRIAIGAGTVLTLLLLAFVVVRATSGPDDDDPGRRSAGLLVEPGVRIRVEVLNATRTPRLARHATRVLRDRGFDVVAIGNASEQLDSTLILDRTNHPEWAALAATALQGARIEARPDTSRYLDLTILVGASWTPPPEALYP